MKYNWPSGIIVFLPEGSSVPSGWTRQSVMDGKLIRANSTAGGSGSGTSHTHGLDPDAVWSSRDRMGESKYITGGTNFTEIDHRHVVNRSSTVSAGDSTMPPYIDVVVIKKD